MQHDFFIERNRVSERVIRKCNMISLLKGIGLGSGVYGSNVAVAFTRVIRKTT